jgi:hypothetical protein
MKNESSQPRREHVTINTVLCPRSARIYIALGFTNTYIELHLGFADS